VLRCTALLLGCHLGPGIIRSVVSDHDPEYVVKRSKQQMLRFSALSASGVEITTEVRGFNCLRVSQCV
jgi:hypothetical protein